METTPRTAEIEIALEEFDEGFWRAALADPYTAASGSGRYRLVVRPADDPDAAFAGSPFTMPRSSVAGLADDGTVDLEARVRLGELDTALATAGWRPLPERGLHWWSLRYARS